MASSSEESSLSTNGTGDSGRAGGSFTPAQLRAGVRLQAGASDLRISVVGVSGRLGGLSARARHGLGGADDGSGTGSGSGAGDHAQHGAGSSAGSGSGAGSGAGSSDCEHCHEGFTDARWGIPGAAAASSDGDDGRVDYSHGQIAELHVTAPAGAQEGRAVYFRVEYQSAPDQPWTALRTVTGNISGGRAIATTELLHPAASDSASGDSDASSAPPALLRFHASFESSGT